METLAYIATNPLLAVFLIGILGLIVGSFLNVIIYRLPVMMERDWRKQCEEILQQPTSSVTEPVFNIAYPPSRCPHCGHQITALENIPILSYLWQRGQCTGCHASISSRYPIIEGVSALLAMITVWQAWSFLGFGLPLLGVVILTWALLALSMIDIDHQLLPDDITLPFLWLGVLLNLLGFYPSVGLYNSIIGVMAGYMSLWSVYILFKLVTGKEGMGAGDFKLLAMLGAWMGWQALPVIVILSSLVGATFGILMIVVRGQDKSIPISFGPYLAMAGWIHLLWGDMLIHWYQTMMGVSIG
ncbi:prepilin peptidase [Beggiatoa leptomitoformis]|uniref:Prepilin leader peptidase/N-methyltransferase n=1 Tax=Beggiatoa leptomitoformis TaxID=288004 RepID=A0A2N9YH48_9GAMM|nr:A24 family peptidase [Beggiatoa leptomitoformis]ALG67988.1 prepilin peptidase [Beggiatoa leptomitoformis]AUI69729.1 prepilin peptidase [Beggiatoa leptomitoformis]